MTDLEPILTLWRELEAAGSEYVLATVVAVEGSSYRRPGAHMLIAPDGRRTGTVSGGCLEADVAKRAWWLTSNGPVVERFSTLEDDGERPYGSGCGGTVFLLLERKATSAPLLARLRQAFERRVPVGIATVIEGGSIGRRAIAQDSGSRFTSLASDAFPKQPETGIDHELLRLALQALNDCASRESRVPTDDGALRVWADYRPARTGLWIFGAGDDAKSMVHLARELGWFTAVADGRSHLATRDRFPAAHQVAALDIAELPGTQLSRLDLRPTDAAVVMTHSFEQDSRILASLLSLESPPAYIGALGPQRRTREMLADAARMLGVPVTEAKIESWLETIHAPTGLDLGADTPASIALSILAEIQQATHKGTGLPLRFVRGEKVVAGVRGS